VNGGSGVGSGRAWTGFVRVNDPWIAALHELPDALRAGAAASAQLATERDGAKWLPMPYPLTVDEEDYARLGVAARHLLAAQTAILRHLLATRSHADVCAMFGLPASIGAHVDWAALPHGRQVISRLDVLPSGDRFWFCELNCDSALGGSELFDCSRAFATRLGWPLYDRQRSPAADVAALLRRAVGRRDYARVVLCDWSSYRDAGYFDFGLLLGYVRAALPGVDVELRYQDDYPRAWLAPGAGSDILFYRCFMHEDMGDGGAFFDRVTASGATVVSGFETDIRSHKGWLAHFFDPRWRHLLSAAQVRAIEEHVPRTVPLRSLGLRAAVAQRDRYVFKLDRAVGGAGVLIGSELSARELAAALSAHDPERWVVQRYVEADTVVLGPQPSEAWRQRIVLGLYVVDGAASGLLVRGSRTSKVVNVMSGGTTGSSWCVPTTAAERSRLLQALRRSAAPALA
jgi:hypothetical protein